MSVIFVPGGPGTKELLSHGLSAQDFRQIFAHNRVAHKTDPTCQTAMALLHELCYHEHPSYDGCWLQSVNATVVAKYGDTIIGEKVVPAAAELVFCRYCAATRSLSPE